MTTTETELKPGVCAACNQASGTNPDCTTCQEVAAAGADRETAKVGGVQAMQLGEPRAFTARGRVD